LKKLSKGFTIENEMAIQLDKLLVEQLELEGSAKQIKSTKPKSPSKDNEPTEDIKQRFNDLFDAIKNNTGNKE
jgi:hypothetical protein